MSALHNRIAVALLVHILCTFTPLRQCDMKMRSRRPGTCIFDSFGYSSHFIEISLIARSGDVHPNPGPPSDSSDLCVMHINARSLREKGDLLQAEANKFDIITVSETWLDPDKFVPLIGFHEPIRCDRLNDPHGGVAIYVRNTLICKPRPDLEIPTLESVWIETRLNQTRFLVGSFYRPPSAPVGYWDLVEAGIRKADSTGLMFMILGDFNTNWLAPPSQHLTKIANLFNMHQLILEPTRYTENTRTCLDLVLIQNTNIVKNVVVLPPICSDHCVPCVTIYNTVPKPKPYKREIFLYDRLDVDKFCNLLSSVDWTTILDLPINDAVDLFTSTFLNLAKQCMPVKNVTIRPNDALWLNEEIRLLIEERKRIHTIAKQTDKPEDWESFRKIRNQVVDKVKNRKIEYVETLNSKVCDPENFGKKDWWKLVKSFLSKKGLNPDEIPPIESEGQTYYSSKDKANAFNNFFVSQASLDDDTTTPPVLTQSGPELLHVTLTTDEVKLVLNNLDTTKAIGPDLINNRLLKVACDVIAEPLTMLYNKSLHEGIFPDIWKKAHVTPIHKKGPKSICNNYRPISLLSCVGKVFEKCVHSHVFNFLSENSIISEMQSGFIPGDSTVNQLLSIYNEICSNSDVGLTTQSVYLDLSKAFDRVWHRGLLSKLEAVGVRGGLLRWFRSYLTGRIQATVVKGEMSDFKNVPAGVPQGSVLGPLLFLIYINDIVQEVRSVIRLFADDTSLSLALENATLRAETLNDDLERINNWAKTWKMVFNAGKTDVVNYGRAQNDREQLVFNDLLLTETPSHKHLGLTLQSNGKWDEHITSIASKANTLISCLKNLKYKLNRKALETMYKSFILPIFDYADIIWDNCTVAQSNLLENLHLEAIRTIIGGVRGTSHYKLYEESGFCSLKERRHTHKLLTFKKLTLGLCPNYLYNLLPPLVSTVNPHHRRRPLDRYIPRCRTELYRNSFFPSTSGLWNTLPLHLQNTQSLGEFKHFLNLSTTKVPSYYYYGDRAEQAIHCRLRLQMSDLNNDLFSRHLSDNPMCSCGLDRESAEHYLLYCSTYNNLRANTIHSLPDHSINITSLLKGDPSLNLKENERIFRCVHAFIRESERFKR